MWYRTKRAVFFLASVAILLLSVAGSARAQTSDAGDLNNAAAALGPGFTIEFDPSRYLRPFDTLDGECEFGFLCRNPFLQFGLH